MEQLELGWELGCQTQHNTMHTELWSPSLAGKKNLKKKKGNRATAQFFQNMESLRF